MIERQRAFGHGVLRVWREHSAHRCGCWGRPAFSSRSWAGTRPYQIVKGRQGDRPAGRAASRSRAKPTCRGASPRASARGLLVVTGHRLETSARGAVATRGLDIGRCKDDMGGAENRVTGGAMEPKPQERERRWLDALHRAALFCDQRIGWNRVGVALSITIIAIAAVALYRILRTIDPSEVVEALVTTDLRHITLAAVFVAGGYFTLTFYDLFALRTIGRKDVPYWAAALAAFTSYSVGHNVGASVFTGGAVRYRVYSAWGLTAVEVAKICFVAGLTFWLGNATVLGLGILYAPLAATAIDQLPAWLNRSGAVLIVIVLALYVG